LSVTVAFVMAASYNSSYKPARRLGLLEEPLRKPEVQFVLEFVWKIERGEAARNRF
jgi:hypothetical protein